MARTRNGERFRLGRSLCSRGIHSLSAADGRERSMRKRKRSRGLLCAELTSEDERERGERKRDKEKERKQHIKQRIEKTYEMR